MVVRFTMDLFQHRYYRLNKTLMTLIGQWPYQSTRAKRGLNTAFILFIIGQVVPQTLAFVKCDEWKCILDCLLIFLFDAIFITKWIGFMCTSQKAAKLLNTIRTDWQLWARYREVNILHEYAENGKKMTILYTAANCSTCFVAMIQPVISEISDSLLKNVSEPRKFVAPVDYYHVDAQEYYWYIIIYSYICVCITGAISIASEIMLIIYVQHVCGIFAALGHALERIGHNYTSVERGETPYALDKREMVHLAWCIDRHNGAIENADLIDITFTWNFIFILGFGIILIIGAGLQILLRRNEPEEVVKFAMFALTLLLHFYVECYISQILIDHSTRIRFYIFNSQYYKLPPKTQKILQFMTMRASVPCQLTAGHFFTLSVMNFGQTVRTTMSYFTVARSLLI